MKKIGIYKITSPSNRIYIGQSIDILGRWKRYEKLNCKKQILLYNSLKKYGYDKHIFEIICECNKDELNKLEKHYVDLYKTFNTKHGLNVKDGGGSQVYLTEEIKKKMSEAKKGRTFSEEHKEKLRQAHLGRKMSEETKKKIGLKSLGNKHNKGRVCKDETKQKMREKGLGKIISKEQREKTRKTLKGHIVSKETREKISESLLKRNSSK